MGPPELVEGNMLALFRHLARARETGEIQELPGVSIASCGAAFHMFNAAFLSAAVTGGAAELERRLTTAAVHFAARGLRWALWLWEHRLDRALRSQADALAARHGLFVASRLPGMLAERIPPSSRPLPELQIRGVCGPVERADFCRLVAMAFGLSVESSREIYGLEAIWRDGLTGFVGYVQGRPVSTAAAMTDACATGLYCVATAPGWERRGYAEAIVRHTLEHALAPGRPCVLQSTDAGRRLYERMGFRTVTKVTAYSS
ncbi:MAG: GNAT family N-acetyltransferase [Bryobacterales bacterium]|nr:GNAT family N-acetyltransferase [Bryobacterales bacterium]